MKKQKCELRTNRDKALRALQEIELEALKEIDRICRKNNIEYSLGGGTCLGRVRHGGFIPWDDDIDIDMTIDNYEKFLEIAPKEMDTDRFFLRCRKTDKNHLRTNSRFEIKNTTLINKLTKRAKADTGCFVDIMCWTYLPNNKFLRKVVSTSLFYIRCIYNYKMTDVLPKKANQKLDTLICVLSKIMPVKFLNFIEDKLRRCCKHRTGWIFDDALVNGNHGGYPSNGIDTVTDVTFEGIKVMDKENPHTFLSKLYGKNYMEWLPPTARISHHHWIDINFGPYEKNFDLPKDYQKYLTINYQEENLKRMQEVSLEIMTDIDRVCKRNKITYFVSGRNAYIKANDIDERGQLFYEPFKIAMPRKDYENFCDIAQNDLGNKYFFQTKETDKAYKFNHARIRLNYTYIRERNIPRSKEEKYNNGFFVQIIPLDNTSNDLKERKDHIKAVRRLTDLVKMKWLNYNLKYFFSNGMMTKLKMILILPIPLKTLIKKLDKVTKKYDECNTDYYIDSTYRLDYRTIKKDILGQGKDLNYLGCKLAFPKNLKAYREHINRHLNGSKYKDLRSPDKIDITSLIKKVKKRYSFCFLNYYDIPDYQLSVLRYDEKKKRYLTNEEVMNYQSDKDKN